MEGILVISFLRNLFTKNKLKLVSYPAPRMELDRVHINLIENQISDVEKRLRYIETSTGVEIPENKSITLDDFFQSEINRFSLKEQELIKLYIDKEILSFNKEIKFKDLPWHNKDTELNIEKVNFYKLLRNCYLGYAIDKIFNFRRSAFSVIERNTNGIN